MHQRFPTTCSEGCVSGIRISISRNLSGVSISNGPMEMESSPKSESRMVDADGYPQPWSSPQDATASAKQSPRPGAERQRQSSNHLAFHTQTGTIHQPSTHQPLQDVSTPPSASDGGRSSLNVRMRQSSLQDQHATHVVRSTDSGTKPNSHKRPRGSVETPDQAAASRDRPSKQPFTESRQAQGPNSRSDSFNSGRVKSPARHVIPPSPRATGLPSHYRNLSNSYSKSQFNDTSSLNDSPSSDAETVLLKQPPTRPISEQQLINEVKGIYAGLVMVEKKCVEIVAQQTSSTKRLEPQQWKALVALHRTLLQEHHDFFSASQHPTASDALKRLAAKYAMPARMWRHGIHAFLELLRHRLPDSMEHMLSFIYLSYSMMALLKESVPSFVETWIECLGDLARYRMAIEDSDPRDREIWSNVARTWYNEAADKSPNVGRIQHHLAVLARPNVVEQLFYYTKALTTVIPFINARESIMLLFDTFLKSNETTQARYPLTESSLVHGFSILFIRGSVKTFYELREQYLSSFNAHIDRSGAKLKVQGPQIALALIAGLLDAGKDDSPVCKRCRIHMDKINNLTQKLPDVKPKPSDQKDSQGDKVTVMKPKLLEHGDISGTAEANLKNSLQREEYKALKDGAKVERVPPPPSPQEEGPIRSSEEAVALAGVLFSDTVGISASRIGDKNIVPLMHVVLANLWGLSFFTGALVYVEAHVPWTKIATFLNTIGRSGVSYSHTESEAFPPSYGAFGRQLPEDFSLRGYITMQYVYPKDFFTEPMVGEDERNVEQPSHQAPRAERCLWLGVRLASLGRYLTYDYETKQYGTTVTVESLV